MVRIMADMCEVWLTFFVASVVSDPAARIKSNKVEIDLIAIALLMVDKVDARILIRHDRRGAINCNVTATAVVVKVLLRKSLTV